MTRECKGCGVIFTPGPGRHSTRLYCDEKCRYRAKVRRLYGTPKPRTWSEEQLAKIEERRQERVGAVEEGLDLGLSAEGIASDCGIALPSLVRSLERLGETELLDRLRRRRDGRWVA